MKKSKRTFICQNCGYTAPKWSGQCPDCLQWNSMNEELVNEIHDIPISGQALKLENLDITNISQIERLKLIYDEINLVLGGGLVKGGAILLGGDPGIGKSTLLLQLLISIADNGTKALYVTGEESADQVKLRASRINNSISLNLQLISTTNSSNVLATLEKNKGFKILVIDSIQTIASPLLSSAAGTVSQIRYVTQELINYTKKHDISLFIIGHVTKDGQIAGPKVLEHIVDTVLYFEGDMNCQYRMLRAIKNRYGPINEVGIFEMTNAGLIEVNNPSSLFLSDSTIEVPGTVTFAGIEGSRTILTEIQVLVTPSNIPIPRRNVVGWDHNRLSMILAVLTVRFGVNLSNHEVYLSVVGGIKITEPAADLAIAAALISTVKKIPISKSTIFFGEIGLSGEIRKVSNAIGRIKEAKKIGFDTIICGEDVEDVTHLTHIKHLKQII